MNDELIMNNYLLVLKSCVEVYVHGTLESSNKDVRKTLKDSLDHILTSQANTYDEMVKRNWYQVENIKENIISQTLNKLKKG